MAQHVKPCQVLQFPSCVGGCVCVGGISPQRWIKLKRPVFRPLPKMINPYREHYWALSGCAFSLPVIVLFLLLPSSGSLPFIWKEEKNVWIEKGDFPTVTQLRKIRHCRQVPIPMPCCTARRGLTDSAPAIEWPFFLPSDKYVMEKLNVSTDLTFESIHSGGNHMWLSFIWLQIQVNSEWESA